ncbi:hypothetical protein SO802_019669 [Lithocarpus litseifolius]|uniref:Uncharacterized protein n=1 Tax=Lithocarpus litseifolius TaxID=425828 RepID=A0AAW2CPB4_9ROSI
MKQAPPEIVDTSVDLHRISLQGKLVRTWPQEHAGYIERWAHRGEHVVEAPILDGDTTYLVAYMESYRRMTRRYITRESAYWDMLVESNVASLLQCELGSELYNQLLRTLDLVGEFSRVQLENARAASEASTQATGRGGRGGGSGGRGGAGGQKGGRGPAHAPVRNSEDEHESGTDDEAFDGDWDMYMDGVRTSRCTSDAAAQPSHPAGHDNSAELGTQAQAGPRSPLPTRLSPPLVSGSAYDGGCIFVPTPSRTTPPIVQPEPTQEPSLPNPDEPAAQIELIGSENIERETVLRRSLRTDIHPPGCGTGDGKYHALPMESDEMIPIDIKREGKAIALEDEVHEVTGELAALPPPKKAKTESKNKTNVKVYKRRTSTVSRWFQLLPTMSKAMSTHSKDCGKELIASGADGPGDLKRHLELCPRNSEVPLSIPVSTVANIELAESQSQSQLEELTADKMTMNINNDEHKEDTSESRTLNLFK